ncbi:MAG: hypothetical protein JWN18_306 [Parcubacteria group bacterium]|nr:hypothetical protein [Parcubacteria group bacterium]
MTTQIKQELREQVRQHLASDSGKTARDLREHDLPHVSLEELENALEGLVTAGIAYKADSGRQSHYCLES